MQLLFALWTELWLSGLILPCDGQNLLGISQVFWFWLFCCLSEMRRFASSGVSILCSRPSDHVAGGPAAHTHQSLWPERVSRCDGTGRDACRSKIVPDTVPFLLVFPHRKRNFGMSYLSRDRSGSETYLSLLSDWDLDVAFVSAAKPYLQLRMDIKPSEDSESICLSILKLHSYCLRT